MFLKKAFRAVLVLYNLVLISLLLFTGVGNTGNPTDRLLLLLLSPIALYFALGFLRTLARRKILAGLHNFAFTLSLASASFLLFLNVWSATISADYRFALLVLPLPLYFWGTLLGRLIRALRSPEEIGPQKPEPAVLQVPKETADFHEHRTEPITLAKPALAEAPEPEEQPVGDPKRRDFLKKVGGIGLGLLTYSLLNPKQAGAAFFGSVPGPGTVAVKDTADAKIDPAIKGLQSVTTQYGITEIDDGDPAYYGFVNKDGAWYILQEDETTGDYAYRYASPTNNPTLPDFTDAWDVHDSTLTYNYFDGAF